MGQIRVSTSGDEVVGFRTRYPMVSILRRLVLERINRLRSINVSVTVADDIMTGTVPLEHNYHANAANRLLLGVVGLMNDSFIIRHALIDKGVRDGILTLAAQYETGQLAAPSESLELSRMMDLLALSSANPADASRFRDAMLMVLEGNMRISSDALGDGTGEGEPSGLGGNLTPSDLINLYAQPAKVFKSYETHATLRQYLYFADRTTDLVSWIADCSLDRLTQGHVELINLSKTTLDTKVGPNRLSFLASLDFTQYENLAFYMHANKHRSFREVHRAEESFNLLDSLTAACITNPAFATSHLSSVIEAVSIKSNTELYPEAFGFFSKTNAVTITECNDEEFAAMVGWEPLLSSESTSRLVNYLTALHIIEKGGTKSSYSEVRDGDVFLRRWKEYEGKNASDDGAVFTALSNVYEILRQIIQLEIMIKQPDLKVANVHPIVGYFAGPISVTGLAEDLVECLSGLNISLLAHYSALNILRSVVMSFLPSTVPDLRKYGREYYLDLPNWRTVDYEKGFFELTGGVHPDVDMSDFIRAPFSEGAERQPSYHSFTDLKWSNEEVIFSIGNIVPRNLIKEVYKLKTDGSVVKSDGKPAKPEMESDGDDKKSTAPKELRSVIGQYTKTIEAAFIARLGQYVTFAETVSQTMTEQTTEFGGKVMREYANTLISMFGSVGSVTKPLDASSFIEPIAKGVSPTSLYTTYGNILTSLFDVDRAETLTNEVAAVLPTISDITSRAKVIEESTRESAMGEKRYTYCAGGFLEDANAAAKFRAFHAYVSRLYNFSAPNDPNAELGSQYGKSWFNFSIPRYQKVTSVTPIPFQEATIYDSRVASDRGPGYDMIVVGDLVQVPVDASFPLPVKSNLPREVIESLWYSSRSDGSAVLLHDYNTLKTAYTRHLAAPGDPELKNHYDTLMRRYKRAVLAAAGAPLIEDNAEFVSNISYHHLFHNIESLIGPTLPYPRGGMIVKVPGFVQRAHSVIYEKIRLNRGYQLEVLTRPNPQTVVGRFFRTAALEWNRMMAFATITVDRNERMLPKVDILEAGFVSGQSFTQAESGWEKVIDEDSFEDDTEGRVIVTATGGSKGLATREAQNERDKDENGPVGSSD